MALRIGAFPIAEPFWNDSSRFHSAACFMLTGAPNETGKLRFHVVGGAESDPFDVTLDSEPDGVGVSERCYNSQSDDDRTVRAVYTSDATGETVEATHQFMPYAAEAYLRWAHEEWATMCVRAKSFNGRTGRLIAELKDTKGVIPPVSVDRKGDSFVHFCSTFDVNTVGDLVLMSSFTSDDGEEVKSYTLKFDPRLIKYSPHSGREPPFMTPVATLSPKDFSFNVADLSYTSEWESIPDLKTTLSVGQASIPSLPDAVLAALYHKDGVGSDSDLSALTFQLTSTADKQTPLLPQIELLKDVSNRTQRRSVGLARLVSSVPPSDVLASSSVTYENSETFQSGVISASSSFVSEQQWRAAHKSSHSRVLFTVGEDIKNSLVGTVQMFHDPIKEGGEQLSLALWIAHMEGSKIENCRLELSMNGCSGGHWFTMKQSLPYLGAAVMYRTIEFEGNESSCKYAKISYEAFDCEFEGKLLPDMSGEFHINATDFPRKKKEAAFSSAADYDYDYNDGAAMMDATAEEDQIVRM